MFAYVDLRINACYERLSTYEQKNDAQAELSDEPLSQLRIVFEPRNPNPCSENQFLKTPLAKKVN